MGILRAWAISTSSHTEQAHTSLSVIWLQHVQTRFLLAVFWELKRLQPSATAPLLHHVIIRHPCFTNRVEFLLMWNVSEGEIGEIPQMQNSLRTIQNTSEGVRQNKHHIFGSIASGV